MESRCQNQKINMKNRVIYGCFLAGIILCYLMSDSAYGSFALGMTLLMAVMLFGETIYIKHHVTGYIQLKEPMVTRGDAMNISVIIHNTGLLSVSQVCATIKYKEENARQYKTTTVYGMVDSKGEISLESYLKTVHCNVVTLYLEKISVRDSLGIFSGNCQVERVQKELYILPWTNIPMADTLSQVGDFAGKYGEDIYETYDIREFREGDDIRQIHWKLTAKMDVLLLREYLKTSESGVMIALELSKENEKQYTKEELDSFLDRASSLSWEILRWGVSHYVTWDKEGEGMTLFIETEENFIEYQMILIQTVVCDVPIDATYNKEKVVNEDKVHTIRMDLAGKVSWEE